MTLSISQKTLLAGMIAGLFAVGVAVWLGVPDFAMDDAYIVQHTVEGLFRGGESRYLDSSPMTGATSPAHVLLIASLAWAIPVEWAQLVVIGAAAALYVAGCFHLALKFGAPTLWAAIVATLSALAGLSFYQMFNGLETGLAMAGVAWALCWFYEPTPRRAWQYALLGALPYVRPELAALSGLIFLRAAWGEWQAGRSTFVVRMSTAFIWIVAGAAPVALFLLANGQAMVPNTVSAKAYFFAEGCRPAAQKAHDSVRLLENFVGVFGLASVGFLAMAFSRFRWVGMIFVAAVIGAYFVSLPGALFHNYYRYLHILVPFAIAGWAMLVAAGDKRVRLAGKGGLAVALGLAIVGFGYCWTIYAGSVKFSREQLRGVSEWVATNVPETSTVLVHDAGYISHFGKQKLVDIVGLKTPSSIEAHHAYTWPNCGPDARAISLIAGEANARYMVVLHDWNRDFKFTAGLVAMGWSVERIDAARGDTAYEVYEILPPNVSHAAA